MEEKKKKKVVIVTGGTGLVGHGILLFLEKNPRPTEHWVFLSSSDGDLRDLQSTKNIFEKHRPTHVIHLAASVGGLFKNMRRKVEMFRDNMSINDNVLLCCKEYKVEKCISCMSTCIFPDEIKYPMDETMIHLGPPHPSNEGYAYAKRMVDILNRAYNEQYGEGCKYTSVVPTNVFGPYDNFNVEDSHVIPGLIHKCFLSVREKQQKMIVYGSGKPKRQFIYSLDLGALLVWSLDHYHDVLPLILSVGADAEVSISEAVKEITIAMGFQGELVFDTTKADGQFRKTASNKKLLSMYPVRG
eukprot:TRINITY_DN1879_c2_g1_i1.p1 TRINITY_DN1879_c2_g1~~TRINITY_DN1879_c2_g1_i1.p1  ORF type:complete len:300 (-),score=73.53 TRINITY_DN1879_c2_g1_i1:132-1031(-)